MTVLTLPAPQPTSPQASTFRPPCPTCGVPLPGLLALCRRSECLTAFLDDDALTTRAHDI